MPLASGVGALRVRKGSSEEIPLVQGKRNPSKMVGVAREHQRADKMKTTNTKLTKLITWTTALSSSMKL